MLGNDRLVSRSDPGQVRRFMAHLDLKGTIIVDIFEGRFPLDGYFRHSLELFESASLPLKKRRARTWSRTVF